MKEFFESALDLLFPENLYCLCCGDTMEQNRIYGICDRCAEKMSWHTDDPFASQKDEFAFDELFPCCLYGFYARRIVSRMKLTGTPYAVKGIGLLLAARLAAELARPEYDPDALVFVPMHRDKQRVRGYNQTELLARTVSERSQLPVRDVLIKTKATQSMRMSDALTRRQLLEDSAAVREGSLPLIENRHLVLVDDVVTTGSTADAVSRVLLAAGAARVDVLCFAVSPNVHYDSDAEDEIKKTKPNA